MTPSEYRSADLLMLEDDFGVTVDEFWTHHDDIIGDILHARTTDGREFARLPFTSAEWREEEEPAKDKVWVLTILSKLETLVHLFRREEHAIKWLAAWVHNNRYDEMDVLDESNHDLWQEHWEAGRYDMAADLWFGHTEDCYILGHETIHPISERVEIRY